MLLGVDVGTGGRGGVLIDRSGRVLTWAPINSERGRRISMPEARAAFVGITASHMDGILFERYLKVLRLARRVRLCYL